MRKDLVKVEVPNFRLVSNSQIATHVTDISIPKYADILVAMINAYKKLEIWCVAEKDQFKYEKRTIVITKETTLDHSYHWRHIGIYTPHEFGEQWHVLERSKNVIHSNIKAPFPILEENEIDPGTYCNAVEINNMKEEMSRTPLINEERSKLLKNPTLYVTLDDKRYSLKYSFGLDRKVDIFECTTFNDFKLSYTLSGIDYIEINIGDDKLSSNVSVKLNNKILESEDISEKNYLNRQDFYIQYVLEEFYLALKNKIKEYQGVINTLPKTLPLGDYE